MPADNTKPTSREVDDSSSLMQGLREIEKGLISTRDGLAFETNADILGDALCELIGLQTELDSLRLQLVDQCRFTGVPQSVGVRTVGQYVAARTNNAAAGSNVDTAMNQWVRDYPAFSAALERRDMTMAHLRYIKKHLFSGRSFDALRDDQQFLADAARDCSFKDFTKVCDYWLVHIDPDGEEPKDQIASCGLTLRKGLGGRGKIEIETDAATFAAFKKMIDHEVAKIRAANHDPAADHDQANAHGFAGTGMARIRLQALLSLMQRGFQRDDGSYPTPLFNFVMSPALVDWANAQLRGATDDSVPVDPFDVDGLMWAHRWNTHSSAARRRMTGLWRLDTPTLCRYVLDAKDRIVDYSYNARFAPEHLRSAVNIEHRGSCAVTGCDATHSWLQVDHVDPYSNGGPTSLRNSEPQCAADNMAKGAAVGLLPHKDRPTPPRYQRPQHERPRLHRPTRDGSDDEDAAR